MADQAKGGLGNYPTARCLPGGMPRMMTFGEHEYVITPETTYILIGGEDHFRRKWRRPLSSNLHRRVRLAHGPRADLCGLFHWQMDR